ncbi:MAG: UDP-N-acetylglucosamine 2-epimerase (non-hydrolyzing) [Deltaproteobacteria bacterium HGW-Deltaproteobacteria-18]|nr:MAG: UDP-N-acetylglucosamine 2-epimerase (non-hydrolyzing) [Deltaproteobacteria bacterium HGW-Deltaproteobacteria-18]
MKILTVVGARPQFIKASAVSRAILSEKAQGANLHEVIVHTGQHFDANMSKVFFEELSIPEPDYHLGIASLGHGAMTGRMLEAIESVLFEEKPDIMLVYGDTNSTLAGALAAAKLHLPVAHVEAGLRSFNKRMPEEVNRILTDHVSNLLFCPTQTAVNNLGNEGIRSGVHLVGDVMNDVTLHYRELAAKRNCLDKWGVTEKGYALCTVHRAENTDDAMRLQGILTALREIAEEVPVLLPLHPRTRKIIEAMGQPEALRGLTVLEPLSYLEMLRLEMSARVILTDSGGVQKEAFLHRVPCITLRDETEWVETVEMRRNVLTGANREAIINAWIEHQSSKLEKKFFITGKTAYNIVKIIINRQHT